MNLKKLVLIVTIAAVACGAMAQGGGGGQGRRGGQRGGNPYSALTLLRRGDVQKDLAITDDQKTKIDAIQSGMRQKMTDARTAAGDDQAAQRAAMTKVTDDAAKDALAVLTPDQVTRLKGITVQLAGSRAATIKEIQAELNLTDDQKKSIADLQQRQGQANREIGQKVQDGTLDAAGARDERTKNDKVLGDEIEKVLTDAQKAKLKDMAGKPFTAEPQQGRGGGGGGL